MEESLKNSSFDLGDAALVTARDVMPEESLWHNLSDEGRDNSGSLLPSTARLAELLGLDDTSAINHLLRTALLRPIAELTSNRGKWIRGQLVMLGHRLISDAPASVLALKQCRSCADVVELIHAGSLIVDDIEDGSRVRRGRPALHVQYGLPIALNAGNWLYFWAFELIRDAELPQDRTFYVYEHCHRTLLRAHFGQAVDLGTRVDALPQNRVAAACLASMKLKTGALMGFAMIMGGAIAGASERLLSVLDEFGRDLGVALQMFDDLGNVIGKCEPSKRYEDLELCRPSWVWACVANGSTPEAYKRFCAAAAKLPDAQELEIWIEEQNLMQRVRASARRQLDFAFRQLESRLDGHRTRWSKCAFDELRQLGEEITIAYG
jgi:geranylgeranyl pyrophosphate synthase